MIIYLLQIDALIPGIGTLVKLVIVEVNLFPTDNVIRPWVRQFASSPVKRSIITMLLWNILNVWLLY